ncbi:hypothetical protein Bca4012_043593 [Brassica carinata]|uniref:Uncharacterized protein n=1 Tax=Brassica carinata TaxID=52824 RepID=A0A8X7QTS9_BRACI|nr:hypothetical protein Bca52824_058742 [Brassica carinata]
MSTVLLHQHEDGQRVLLRLLLKVDQEASTDCLGLYLRDLEFVSDTGNDDVGDDLPRMNSVSAKVDVGGSALEVAPTTLAGPSDLDTKKPSARASLNNANANNA